MATLMIPPLMRDAVDDQAVISVPSGSVRSALEAACQAHPALRARLFDEDGMLHPHIAVMVDAAQIEALSEPVGPDAEVVLVPAIGGGRS